MKVPLCIILLLVCFAWYMYAIFVFDLMFSKVVFCYVLSLRKQPSFFAPGPSGVPSRETPLGLGAKKDGCFRRLLCSMLCSLQSPKTEEIENQTGWSFLTMFLGKNSSSSLVSHLCYLEKEDFTHLISGIIFLLEEH